MRIPILCDACTGGDPLCRICGGDGFTTRERAPLLAINGGDGYRLDRTTASSYIVIDGPIVRQVNDPEPVVLAEPLHPWGLEIKLTGWDVPGIVAAGIFGAIVLVIGGAWLALKLAAVFGV